MLLTQEIVDCTHFSLSALYVWAISGTRGSSGFGSQRREQIDNNTVKKHITRLAGQFIDNRKQLNTWETDIPGLK